MVHFCFWATDNSVTSPGNFRVSWLYYTAMKWYSFVAGSYW